MNHFWHLICLSVFHHFKYVSPIGLPNRLGILAKTGGIGRSGTPLAYPKSPFHISEFRNLFIMCMQDGYQDDRTPAELAGTDTALSYLKFYYTSSYIEHFILSIVDGFPLRPIFTEPLSEITGGMCNSHGCIIDDPNRTMQHPLIDFDITSVTSLVLNTAKMPSIGSRTKCLLASVRGVGGGKTRTFEELRRYFLLTKPNVVPVAITFGHYTSYDRSELSTAKDSQMSLALSIVSRMLYEVFYIDRGIKQIEGFETMMKLVRTRCNQYSDIVDDFTLSWVFQQCVKVIVNKVNQQSGRQIDTFVLMVDESAKLLGSYNDYSVVLNALRRSLLDDYIDGNLDVALVMSSLSLSPLGKVDPSSRPVTPIILPSKLNSTRIVYDWWLKYKGEDIKVFPLDQGTLTLKLLGTILNTLPRVVELVDDCIKARLQKVDDFYILNVDGDFVSSVLEETKLKFQQRYSYTFVNVPSATYLKAMIFQENIPINATVMDLIQCSWITNSLTYFPSDMELKMTSTPSQLVPDTSFLTLATSANIFNSTDESTIKSPYSRRFIWGPLRELYDSMLNYTRSSPKDKGIILEKCLYNWLWVRLGALIDSGCKEVSVSELLGLDSIITQLTDRNISDVIPEPISLPTHLGLVKQSFPPCVHKPGPGQSFTEFLSEDVVLTKKKPISIIPPNDKQAFDFGIIYGDSDTMNVIFLEAKSREEREVNNTEWALPENVDQGMIVTEIMKNFAKDLAQTHPNKTINYVYIYLSSDPAVAAQVDTESRIIWGTRSQLLDFLGPLGGFYAVARSTQFEIN